MLLTPINNASSASIIIWLIANKYFADFYCVLQFTNKQSENKVTNVSPHYLVSSDIKFDQRHIGKFDHCLGIVIQSSDDPRRTFEMFEQFIYFHSKNDFHTRKYIVRFNANQQQEMAQFLLSPKLQFVSDVLIIFEGEKGTFNLLTHQYTGANYSNKAVLLNVWHASNESFQNPNETLFPNKLGNQEGKRLIVGGEKYLPITDPDNLKGPETRLLIEYANRHNVTLVFDKSFNFLGDLRANWTGTGYMGTLLEDKIDLIAYAVYINKDRSDFGDFASPNCEIRVTCLVPKPRLINKWMIFKIFTYDVWLVIAFSFVVVIMVFKIFLTYVKWKNKQSTDENYNENFEYLVIFRLFIGQPGNFDLMTQIERFLISILLACVILIQTFFNSKLSSFITAPTYIDDINTLEELAQSDIFWYSKFMDKGKIISGEKTEPLITLYKKFRHVAMDDLSTLHEEFYAYAVDESFASHFFTIDDYFTLENLQEFKVMREYIIGHQYTAFFLRRNSILLGGINDLCYKSMEHGLIKYWEKDSISDPDERKVQEYLAQSGKLEPPLIKLDVKMLTTIFALWAGGITVSSAGFLLELYVWRYAK